MTMTVADLFAEIDKELESCTHCGGSGEMRVPKTYMTCPCCRGRVKFRPCKKCNGTGIKNANSN